MIFSDHAIFPPVFSTGVDFLQLINKYIVSDTIGASQQGPVI